MTQRAAVIGAGLAGLACARVLQRAGCHVEIFEQDSVVGGRMGTMRLGLVTYDHGAQYVTAHGTQFQSYIQEITARGFAARWVPRFAGEQATSWYVGMPGMSSIVRPLTASAHIHAGHQAHAIERTDKGWIVWFEDGGSSGPFAAVAVAVPAPQAQLLLGQVETVAAPLDKVRMAACWSLMVRLDERTLPEPDVYSDLSNAIRWIARNSTKPGRNVRGETVVVHASAGWTRETEDADPEVVAKELWAEVSHLMSLAPVRPSQMTAHLWRHGLVEQPLGETYVYSREDKVGAAGDWCLGRLAEHAFESGQGLGRAIIASLD